MKKVLHDYVMVELQKESGVLQMDASLSQTKVGKVLKIGARVLASIVIGDDVICTNLLLFTREGKDYYFVKEEDIVAVL